MQQPPDRRSPPILFARGTSEWIARVTQKHKQLSELDLSSAEKERLDRWVEIEFVYSTLNLEGAHATRDQVVRAASASPAQAPEAGYPMTSALLSSLRTVMSLARASGRGAQLTEELLLRLHYPPGDGFRMGAGDTSRVPRPVAPEHLPALIEGACRWYTAESFAELNPIEQASIVLLRLIDIQPFEEANERTALVAASLFTLRSELPPIIIKPQMAPVYRQALDEAARMNTKPMVETIAQAIEQSLSEMFGQIGNR
jgi:Fic family protein